MADNIPITAIEITGSTIDPKCNERLHLYPKERIEAILTTTGLVGLAIGLYDGVKISSARYLAENAHRLPTKVGGWYFYHKKKNYVMITQSLKFGIKSCIKYSLPLGCFVSLEYLFDLIRGNTIDFLNTTASAFIISSGYCAYNKLAITQARTAVLKGSLFGLGLGLIQDYLIHKRGGKIWYIDRFNI
ncbi:unnamed protein product [Candida verbasci]|uniref:Uncharacterized protein n=1 Tax=Candida verbasci TaxID=1227364 RepID=A0A9W4TSJ5_9ASCO|nr:unnamed protein product [Candida verbasci]